MAKKQEKQIVVHVVLYGHKHGTDCWVTSSEDKAWASIKGTIKHYLGDLYDADAAKKIKKLLKAGKVLDASNLWAERMEEWFDIHQRVVDT